MKSADVSGISKELEEVRRIALGEVPADEAQVRAALAQAWAWLAPLTSASLSDEPSPGAAKSTTEDVERWFRAVVARTKGSIETMMARMLRDAALEGAKVVELERAALARAEAHKRTSLALRDTPSALSAPPAETTLAPSSPAVPDGSTPPAYRMLSQLDVRPTVPPLLPVSERIQQSLAKLGHEPTPLTTAAADALHPTGHCTCAVEGTCAWCRARCGACGSPYIPEAVRHALAKVWSALHVTTAHQGVAVAVLRAVYPELPVPNARAGADSLLAWETLAQVVTEAARLGAENMRARAAHLLETASIPLPFENWQGTKRELTAHFARALAVRIRDLQLPGEEVARG